MAESFKMPEEAVMGYCMESVTAFQNELLADYPAFTKAPIKPEFRYEELSAVGLPMCIWDGASDTHTFPKK